MDDYRRYRQTDNSAKNELFRGATNNTNNQYPPPPPYGGYQQPQYGGYQQPQYGGYQPTYAQQEETEEDVEEIKSQIHSVKQASVNSTLKSLQMLEQAEQAGQNTLNKLGEQTQRINYTERQLDLADAHAERASEQASKLKKVNGSMFGFDVSNPFTKGKREAKELARVQAMQEEQRTSRENMRAGNWESQQRINAALKQGQNQTNYQPGKSSQAQRSKFQFEADDEDNAMEDQIDNNLDKLSVGLTRLNAMASAAGQEIRNQNESLDRISSKTEKVDNSIVKTTHSLKKIR
ncbi:hypothetical protein RclHR1_00090004 [Rhizophagus clarus]|uniref:t-SNARE component Sec9 n=1 Tax=Rhizophagus clarus TaxID=94130 RepID=A0A2Z6SGH5_9GLOM|nr:hypothetical protein RclHR1_00090004 [Rhizophagus clarus]GES90521.1 t-SNARE component Sec9 [Rhizophagus clarus]